MNPRVACARILATILHQESSLSTLLASASTQVEEQDLGLLQEICYGTLRHLPALEVIADRLLDKPLKRKDKDVYALILSGLYQIREMRTPAHAAVNETVAACTALKKSWARGVINGILRRYLREREAIDSACMTDSNFQTLHPAWLQQHLEQAWGDRAPAIMSANNLRPPMTLRVNFRQNTRQEYLDLLAENQLSARPAPFAPAAIYLDSPCDVARLPGFDQGRASVQDEAAQLCGELLDLAPGQRVLDSCCAPGGKTCHILELAPDLAELVALEVDASRLARVEQNLRRLKLSATLKCADALDLPCWWDNRKFDRILLDAPCSATGVIRRHPDIKVLRRAGDIDKLAAIQRQLLDTLWSTLKVGGKLLYATCSVFPEENDAVIDWFAHTRPDCSVRDIDAGWGVATARGRQVFPSADGHDGFYYALLVKSTPETGNGTT